MSPGPYDDGRRLGGGRSYAIASLVLGVLSLPLIFMPPGGIYLGMSAVVGSLLAMRRGGGHRKMAIAGGILGVIAVLVGTFLAIGICGPSILWFECRA